MNIQETIAYLERLGYTVDKPEPLSLPYSSMPEPKKEAGWYEPIVEYTAWDKCPATCMRGSAK